MTKRAITPAQYRQAHRLYSLQAKRACEALDIEHPHLKFQLDPMVGVNVAIATYDDIDRFKSYHLRNRVPPTVKERSDVVKRAAYFTKWTVKLRPIMFVRMTQNYPTPDIGLLANESFAMVHAIGLISAEIGTDISLTDKALHHILYDLHYRTMSDDALIAYFQMIVDIAKDGRPNPIVEFSIV